MFLLAAVALGGCTGKPTRVEAHLAGDSGKYQGFPVCVEVSYQNEETLGIYVEDLCSDGPVEGAFDVTLSGEADDLENDVVNAFGVVFLRANAMEITGTETSRVEEDDGDLRTLSVAVSF